MLDFDPSHYHFIKNDISCWIIVVPDDNHRRGDLVLPPADDNYRRREF